MKKPASNKPEQTGREAGMMTTTGAQGSGKTYQNMHIIANYVKDKFAAKIRGRKSLIFDTNGEYTESQFAANGIPNFAVPRISIKDVKEWCLSDRIECRRLDAKNLGIKEKRQCLEYLMHVFRNGLLVIEDPNTYVLQMAHMEEVVGGMVNLRHKAADVLISFQSLRPVEPRIWQNSRWIRMHYQNDDVDDIKNKVTNPELFKIAQLMVNTKFFSGNERFFLYIHIMKNKMEGEYTLEEFKEVCHKYLLINKRKIKEFMQINPSVNRAAAISTVTEKLISLYYV